MMAQETSLIFDLAETAAAGLASPVSNSNGSPEQSRMDQVLSKADVFVLDYPDPTRADGGGTADVILNDLVPAFQVNSRELELARERLLRPLTMMLREVAGRQGWTCVDGIFEAFRSHGYAATDTWFIRAKESEQLQGPRLTPVGYLRGEIAPGMLHPNRRGHEVISDRLYRRHAAKGSSFLDASPRIGEATVGQPGGVIREPLAHAVPRLQHDLADGHALGHELVEGLGEHEGRLVGDRPERPHEAAAAQLHQSGPPRAQPCEGEADPAAVAGLKKISGDAPPIAPMIRGESSATRNSPSSMSTAEASAASSSEAP